MATSRFATAIVFFGKEKRALLRALSKGMSDGSKAFAKKKDTH